MRLKLTTILVLFSVLICASGYAQDPHSADETAEGHYRTAIQLFDEGRYRSALDEFDAAISLSPQAVFYCNRAIVLIKLQETEQAVQSLQECRDRFEGDEAEKAQIDAQLQGVSAFHNHVRTMSPQVAIDIARGELKPPKDGWGLQEWGLITAGIGVAILGGAIALDLSSASLKDEYIEESNGGDPERYQELRDSLDSRKSIFWTLTAVGGATFVAGVVMVLIPNFSSESDGSAVLVPIIGQDAIGVQSTWKW